MKFTMHLFLAGLLCIGVACTKENNEPIEDTPDEITGSSKSVVVYFSNPLPGVDAVAGASITFNNDQKYGSVQYMAEVIKEETGSDIHRITVEENHYPTVYRDLADFANNEKAENARPKLTSTLSNLDDYDTIFLGSPIWWYTLPMPIFSFLDQYDLSGKKIIPFTAHEGSGLGGAPATIKTEEPEANVETNGFSARGTQSGSQADAIKSWLKSLGF